ncbi:hypothetical protein HT594_00012 [Phenacoccus solenopsis nudivirus]|nr:hypothetical protein HT594_00012 [Phenacoccus solenopsis nudivirus]
MTSSSVVDRVVSSSRDLRELLNFRIQHQLHVLDDSDNDATMKRSSIDDKNSKYQKLIQRYESLFSRAVLVDNEMQQPSLSSSIGEDAPRVLDSHAYDDDDYDDDSYVEIGDNDKDADAIILDSDNDSDAVLENDSSKLLLLKR